MRLSYDTNFDICLNFGTRAETKYRFWFRIWTFRFRLSSVSNLLLSIYVFILIPGGTALYVDQTYDIGKQYLTVFLCKNVHIRTRNQSGDHPQVVVALAFTDSRTTSDYSWIARTLEDSTKELTGKHIFGPSKRPQGHHLFREIVWDKDF